MRFTTALALLSAASTILALPLRYQDNLHNRFTIRSASAVEDLDQSYASRARVDGQYGPYSLAVPVRISTPSKSTTDQGRTDTTTSTSISDTNDKDQITDDDSTYDDPILDDMSYDELSTSGIEY